MNLKPKGAQVLMFDADEKINCARDLMAGERTIFDYTDGVCYDAAAYVRHLLDPQITTDDILGLSGQNWVPRFNFIDGPQWNGVDIIPSGEVLGFRRENDNRFFHAAIAIGNNLIRGVNGFTLGTGWEEVNLAAVLGASNPDGTFNFDGTRIRVFLSNL